MKLNKLIIVLTTGICSLLAHYVSGQDMVPLIPSSDMVMEPSAPLRKYTFDPDTVSFFIRLPSTFSNTGENRIIDEKGVIRPLLEKLRLGRIKAINDSIRILHVGDSHVRGRIFPNTAAEKLAQIFGPVKYENTGVNGATCLTFTHPARLASIIEANPELIILSFGTNESHNRRYNSTVHYHQIDELIKLIRSRLPEVPVILTTPPGSYDSQRLRNRKRTYSVNPRTNTAVNTIKRYAAEHGLAVWDMYNLAGGSTKACKNWLSAGLMRPDHVHYLPEAYVLHGELLSQAIVNAYNEYVGN